MTMTARIMAAGISVLTRQKILFQVDQNLRRRTGAELIKREGPVDSLHRNNSYAVSGRIRVFKFHLKYSLNLKARIGWMWMKKKVLRDADFKKKKIIFILLQVKWLKL